MTITVVSILSSKYLSKCFVSITNLLKPLFDEFRDCCLNRINCVKKNLIVFFLLGIMTKISLTFGMDILSAISSVSDILWSTHSSRACSQTKHKKKFQPSTMSIYSSRACSQTKHKKKISTINHVNI